MTALHFNVNPLCIDYTECGTPSLLHHRPHPHSFRLDVLAMTNQSGAEHVGDLLVPAQRLGGGAQNLQRDLRSPLLKLPLCKVEHDRPEPTLELRPHRLEELVVEAGEDDI